MINEFSREVPYDEVIYLMMKANIFPEYDSTKGQWTSKPKPAKIRGWSSTCTKWFNHSTRNRKPNTI